MFSKISKYLNFKLQVDIAFLDCLLTNQFAYLPASNN